MRFTTIANILRKNGVKVISAKENISEGPEGIILEFMLEGFVEYYSAELAEKVARGLKENAFKGMNNGGTIPLRYMLLGEEQNLVVNPLTAPLVKEAFTRYAEGETVKYNNALLLQNTIGESVNINEGGKMDEQKIADLSSRINSEFSKKILGNHEHTGLATYFTVEKIYELLLEMNKQPERTQGSGGSASLNNLPLRNEYFAGHKDFLESIRQKLTESFQVIIFGNGGFGKTQIAIEYAYRHDSDYSYIWLVNTSSEISLQNSYRDFAQRTGMPTAGD